MMDEFCCEEQRQKFERGNDHPDLKGLKFKHMKTPCVRCGKLDFVCRQYTPTGTQTDPTCYNCASKIQSPLGHPTSFSFEGNNERSKWFCGCSVLHNGKMYTHGFPCAPIHLNQLLEWIENENKELQQPKIDRSQIDERLVKALHQLKDLADELVFLNEEGNGNELPEISYMCGLLDVSSEEREEKFEAAINRIVNNLHKREALERKAARKGQPSKLAQMITLKRCGVCEIRIPKARELCPECEVFK